MIYVFFSKPMSGIPIERYPDEARRLGVDGFDLAVRPGHAVNPDNVGVALPKAMELFRGEGIEVPLISTPTDLVDPRSSEAERIYGACGASGVKRIKIGYWHYGGENYWERVDGIRRDLELFSRMGERYGVKTLIHTHSGPYYASNCAGAMHLVRGLDPEHVGVYVDPGHMALDGEHPALGFAMVKGYLSMVAAKSPIWARSDGGWETRRTMLKDGIVDWKEVISALKSVGYDDTITVHGEYTDSREYRVYLERIPQEVAYLRSIEEAVRDT